MSPGPIHRRSESAARMSRYQVKEAPLPIGYDYRVEDDHGVEVFQVDGKLWRLRESLDVLDPEKRLLFTIRGGILDVKDTFHIARGGSDVATVKRVKESSVLERFFIALPEQQQAQIVGDVWNHAYTVVYDGQTIATVSKPRLNLRARYVVDVAPEQDDQMVVAISICLDVMTRK